VIAPDGVRVTTRVDADPDTAFRLFTEDVDAWWQRGPGKRFGGAREGRLRFEPGAGGRLLEEFGGAGDAYEVGRVRVWERGARLVFEFRAPSFAAGETTEVEVRFEPEAGATRVTLEHRGWSRLRAGHPARRGLEGPALEGMLGLWWSERLLGLRRRAVAQR
jgi:uncharacterized protein YndB with AHSA1/START domain